MGSLHILSLYWVDISLRKNNIDTHEETINGSRESFTRYQHVQQQIRPNVM